MAIDPLPPSPSRDDAANFSARADAFLLALPTFATQAEAMRVEVAGKAADADADRVAAEAAQAAAEAAAAEAALYVPIHKNLLINGNFDIWQRATSLTSGNFSRFCADRWLVSANGSSYIPSRQAFTFGQTDVPGNPKYFHRVVVGSLAGASNYVQMVQRIEGVTTLSNGSATHSFWARADAARNVCVEFYQDFGTGGSAGLPFGKTTVALTTAWQKFTITAAVPSVAGKTVGTSDNLAVGLWLDAGSSYNARTNSLGQQSGTFDFARMQLERGLSATEFEQRAIAEELALCERYCELGPSHAIWYCISSTSFSAGGQFRTAKRGQPTVYFPSQASSLFHQSNGATYTSGLNAELSNVSFTPYRISPTGFTADVACTGAGSPGFAQMFSTQGPMWIADAEL